MYKMQNIVKKHIKASLKTCQILPLKKKKSAMEQYTLNMTYKTYFMISVC